MNSAYLKKSFLANNAVCSKIVFFNRLIIHILQVIAPHISTSGIPKRPIFPIYNKQPFLSGTELLECAEYLYDGWNFDLQNFQNHY